VRLSGLARSREMEEIKFKRIQMGGQKGEGCHLSILTGGIGSHTKGYRFQFADEVSLMIGVSNRYSIWWDCYFRGVRSCCHTIGVECAHLVTSPTTFMPEW